MSSKKETHKAKEWSITSNLTWIYGLSAFVMLFLAICYLYWILSVSLQKENSQFLQYKTLILQDILLNKKNIKETLKEEVILEPTLYHYYARVVDHKQNVLIETTGMSKSIPVSVYIPLLNKRTHYYPTMLWHSPLDNKSYVLMSTYVQSKTNPHQYYYIETARDVSFQRGIIKDYRRGILFILLFCVIGSAGMGYIITKNGLRPLKKITLTTKKITFGKRQARLDPLSWPKELSELASAFNEMLDRVEKSYNRLAQFSGDLAHELRTPINNMMGAVEIALTRARSKEEYREVLESIFEEFERLTKMIESLLFLAKTENPSAYIQYAQINVAELIKDLTEFYEPLAEEKGIQIKFEGNAHLEADPLMLRRALINLISNGIKHTTKGGTINIKMNMDQQHTYITVADTGSGIAPQHIQHLFDRFYRADSARSQQTGGTGLGLAIVKSIMEIHRGQVTIDSMVGKGTTITLIFPSTQKKL